MLKLLYQLVSFVVLGAYGVNIELYAHENFTELIWASNSTEKCNNVRKYIATRSIRTDTCFIGYWTRKCESSGSAKYMPGDIVLSYNERVVIKSFHICNEEEGGNQLNVDINDYNRHPWNPPEVIESYKNVCSCVNVPEYMPPWYIDNHHNSLLAYYEPNCSVNKWNFKIIAAGPNFDSRNMFAWTKTDLATNTTYYLQSFGPDPNSKYFQISCNSSRVTTESPKVSESSTTESVLDIGADLDNKPFEGLSIQIMELQTQLDQLKEHLITSFKTQFDDLSEKHMKVQEECRQGHQFLSDKIQKFEKEFNKKMKTQNEEFLEVIARLKAFLHGKI